MRNTDNNVYDVRINGEPSSCRSESGQAAVLFALMIIGLVAFVGLAVDGGNVLNVRRVTQNAADASALGGVHYLSVADSPTEQGLLAGINVAVEANGVPDTDGIRGNHINDNVVVHYTDSNGTRLVSPNCNLAGTCGGTPPLQAFGVDVEVNNQVGTYFIRVIGINDVEVGAAAVAVRRGGFSGSVSEKSILALGDDCDIEDRPLAGRAENTEFLGGVHANSWFQNSGNKNHYHTQVSYAVGFDRENVPANEVFEPADPISTTVVTDPFAQLHLSYTDFAITGIYGSLLTSGVDHFDVSILDVDDPPLTNGDGDGIVEQREIINQTIYPELYNPDRRDDLVTRDGVVLGPHQFRTGLYYAGNLRITLGGDGGGNWGQITVVSGNRIKITENDANFVAFLDEDSDVPGLLFFSDYTAPELSDRCEFNPEVEPVINMSNNSGNQLPVVYHEVLEGPPPINCPDDIDGCYVPSSNIYTGLIYAPNGRVATAGGKTTYIGSVIGYTIDVNGNGNLFVNNSHLIPDSEPRIYLDE
jgi:hypothetical protein